MKKIMIGILLVLAFFYVVSFAFFSRRGENLGRYTFHRYPLTELERAEYVMMKLGDRRDDPKYKDYCKRVNAWKADEMKMRNMYYPVMIIDQKIFNKKHIYYDRSLEDIELDIDYKKYLKTP